MQKNLFIYGTLADASIREQLGLKCESVIDYDYIKGFALREITYDEYGTFLGAYKSSHGFISGRVLFNINLDECIDALNEYEGEKYELVEVKTSVHNLKCYFYCEKNPYSPLYQYFK